MRIHIRLLPALCALGGHSPAFAADIDWPTYGLDLSNQRYATPSQIDTGNVGKLTRAWAYHSGVKATFQSTPIMVDRTVYLSLPFNGVVALDAVTGHQLWRYEHPRKMDYPLCCGAGQPGRGSGGRQGLHRYCGCTAGGAGCQVRQGAVGRGGGRRRQRPAGGPSPPSRRQTRCARPTSPGSLAWVLRWPQWYTRARC